jgi:hypothetical protein
MSKQEIKRLKTNVEKLKDQINVITRENEFMKSIIDYTKKLNNYY